MFHYAIYLNVKAIFQSIYYIGTKNTNAESTFARVDFAYVEVCPCELFDISNKLTVLLQQSVESVFMRALPEYTLTLSHHSVLFNY